MKPARVPAIIEQDTESIPTTGAKRRPWKHIVIVERDAAFADLLREGLWQETTCHIVRVTTGEQALRLVPQLRPDLLIVGLHLADMTGMDVFEQLHTIKELVLLPTILLGTPQPGVRTGPPLSICVDQAFDVASLLQTITALLGKIGGWHGSMDTQRDSRGPPACSSRLHDSRCLMSASKRCCVSEPHQQFRPWRLLVDDCGEIHPVVERVNATKDVLEPFHLLCTSRCASRGH